MITVRNNTLSRILPVLGVVCTACIFASCSESSQANGDVPTHGATTISLEQPQYREWVNEISRPGRTEATQMIPLVFLDGGHVATVRVEETDRVRAGQILARVDTTEYAANVARAQVAVDKARRDHARAVRLSEQEVIPTNNAEDALSALQLAEANLRIAEHHLNNATLRAPVDGVIVRRMVEPGQLIGNTSPALVMMVLDPVKVLIGMVDADLVNVSEGDTAIVTINALPEYRGIGRVTKTGLAAASDGTFPVEIQLPNPDLTLRAGMICQVKVRCSQRSRSLMVPAQAVIVGEGDRARVYVYDDGRGIVRRRDVTTGAPKNGWLPVFDGLSENESVVIDGVREVRDGARVTVAGRGGSR